MKCLDRAANSSLNRGVQAAWPSMYQQGSQDPETSVETNGLQALMVRQRPPTCIGLPDTNGCER